MFGTCKQTIVLGRKIYALHKHQASLMAFRGRWGVVSVSYIFLGRVIQFGFCVLKSKLSADSNLSILTPAVGHSPPYKQNTKNLQEYYRKKKKKLWHTACCFTAFFYNYGNFIMIF